MVEEEEHQEEEGVGDDRWNTVGKNNVTIVMLIECYTIVIIIIVKAV